MIREIRTNELNKLLELYTHLHELGVPKHSENLEKTWKSICNDENHHIIVCELDASLPACIFYENRGFKTVKHIKYDIGNDAFMIYEIMRKYKEK